MGAIVIVLLAGAAYLAGNLHLLAKERRAIMPEVDTNVSG
jgi:hypothetical protein